MIQPTNLESAYAVLNTEVKENKKGGLIEGSKPDFWMLAEINKIESLFLRAVASFFYILATIVTAGLLIGIEFLISVIAHSKARQNIECNAPYGDTVIANDLVIEGTPPPTPESSD